MKISHNNYLEYVTRKCPKTQEGQTLLWAFIIGGAICSVGQVFHDIFENLFWTYSEDQLAMVVTATMIFIGSTLTGLGVYDKLGAFAGAGSMIPITGFANSVVSPALEFKSEGWIYGLASKMFIIAGPVIVYGTLGAGLVGLIYFFIYL